MAAGEVGGGWVQQGLVGHAGLHGLGEGVVDLEDGFFGAVVAVFGLVFALHDGEGVHDVADGMAGRGEGAGEGFGLLLPLALGAEVEVEEGGVQLAPQQEAPLLVPPERRPAPPDLECAAVITANHMLRGPFAWCETHQRPFRLSGEVREMYRESWTAHFL